MQKFKEKMDTSKKVENLAVSPQTYYESRCPEQRPNLAANLRNINCESLSSPTVGMASSPMAPPSLIGIMEPCTKKRSTSGSRTKKRINPRNCSGRTVPIEKKITWRDKLKETVGPRLQKMKFNPSDCSQRGMRQLGRQKRSSGPQHSNRKSRIDSLHAGCYDQGSEISGDSVSRDPIDRNSSFSLELESYISMSSVEEAEVRSTYHADSWTGEVCFCPLKLTNITTFILCLNE